MATVKKANVPATHPTVYVGLALAVVGLLLAMYAYTGTRVYDIVFAFVAVGGAVVALAGILLAAWGRSIMSARAARSRRSAMKDDAMKLADEVPSKGRAKPVPPPEDLPTVAAPASKKRFDFSIGRRKEKPAKAAEASNVFAFKRKPAEAGPTTAPAAREASAAPPEPAIERVTLGCPSCATQFSAEGTRPFRVTCPSCGFSDLLEREGYGSTPSPQGS